MRLFWLTEEVTLPNQYMVSVESNPYYGHTTLSVTGGGRQYGFIVLGTDQFNNCYYVNMMRGESPGSGTVLYFAALDWITQFGGGLPLMSDSVVSKPALGVRDRINSQYAQYVEKIPHHTPDSVGYYDRTPEGGVAATKTPIDPDRAVGWRLKQSPFSFEFRA